MGVDRPFIFSLSLFNGRQEKMNMQEEFHSQVI